MQKISSRHTFVENPHIFFLKAGFNTFPTVYSFFVSVEWFMRYDLSKNAKFDDFCKNRKNKIVAKIQTSIGRAKIFWESQFLPIRIIYAEFQPNRRPSPQKYFDLVWNCWIGFLFLYFKNVSCTIFAFLRFQFHLDKWSMRISKWGGSNFIRNR